MFLKHIFSNAIQLLLLLLFNRSKRNRRIREEAIEKSSKNSDLVIIKKLKSAFKIKTENTKWYHEVILINLLYLGTQSKQRKYRITTKSSPIRFA